MDDMELLASVHWTLRNLLGYSTDIFKMYQTNNKQTCTVRKETRKLADRKLSKKYKSSTNTTTKIDSHLPTKLYSKLKCNNPKFYTFVSVIVGN